jgi:hypothetical protein
VDADQPLKTLFRLRPRDLLGLTGDRGARVVSARVIELPATRRSVDTVLRLQRGREVYLRHVEFEMRYRPGLELRLFEYAARLLVQFRLPVLTTVFFLRPPAPAELAHKETIGKRLVHERRFDVVRLWEQNPDELLAMGPGPAALVGQAIQSGVEDVGRAVRLIRDSTQPPDRNDLLYILQALCGERYTVKELAGLIPRGAVMASVMFAKEFRQARAEARAEGRAEGAARGIRSHRKACLDVVSHHHPAVRGRVTPAIEACDSLPTLRKWTVAAMRLSSAEFVRLVAGATRPGNASVSRQRVTRPARRAR